MKIDIRKQMLQKRASLSLEEKEKADLRIIKRIQKDKRYQQAQTVAIYYPMETEINVLKLINDDKTFLFPKVVGQEIVFYVFTPSMRFEKSAFGVNEPTRGVIYEKQIDFIVVPALAIDSNNHRIGYGKGFYDRYLLKHRPKTVIGVIYDFQEITHIDVTPLDQVLDGYVKG